MSALGRRQQAYAGFGRALRRWIDRDVPATSRGMVSLPVASSSRMRLDSNRLGMYTILSPSWSANSATGNDADEVLGRLDTALKTERQQLAASQEPHSQERCDSMIKTLVRQGFVLKAMRHFYVQAIRARDTIGIESFESFFKELASCVRSPPKRTIGPNVNFRKYGSWTPSQLPAGSKAAALPLAVQSTYVAASIFDLALSLGLSPSEASIAPMLSIFSRTLSREMYTRAVNLALSCLSGSTLAEAQLLAIEERSQHTIRLEMLKPGAIPSVVATTIVAGYGRLRAPKVGEDFLRWREAASDAPRTVDTWNALIRARCLSGDQRGASKILSDFRKALRDGQVPRLRYPRKPNAPYFTYLDAVMSMRRQRDGVRSVDLAQLPRQSRSEGVQTVLKMMREDGVGLEPRILNLLLDFEVGHRRIEGAANMVWDMLSRKDVSKIFHRDAHSLAALFRMYRLHDGHAPFKRLLEASAATTPLQEDLVSLRKLHKLALRAVVARREGAQQTMKLLNEALDAALVLNDLPLALVALRSMGRWHLKPDMRTWRAIAVWLRATVFPGNVDASELDDGSVEDLDAEINDEAAKSREDTFQRVFDSLEQRGGVVRQQDVTIATSSTAPISNLKYLMGLVEGQIEKSVNEAGSEEWIAEACASLKSAGACGPFSKEAIMDVVMARVNADVLPRM